MGTFEQLNDFIYIDGKIVFTLNALRDYVYGNEDYPQDIKFEPNGIHKDYWGKYQDFCIDKWLDDEDNFQSACKSVYDKMLAEGETFKSGNSIYPYAKQGIYSIQPATKSK